MTPPKEKKPDCLSIVGKAKAGKQHCYHKSCSPKRTKKIHITFMIAKRERNHRLCQKITVKIFLAWCCVTSAPLLTSYQYESVLLYILHISSLLTNSFLKYSLTSDQSCFHDVLNFLLIYTFLQLPWHRKSLTTCFLEVFSSKLEICLRAKVKCEM